MPTPSENFEFGLNGAKIVLIIGGSEFALVSGPASIQIPGSDKPPTLHFRFEYKESPQTPAITLGTPRAVVGQIQTMLAGDIPAPAGLQNLQMQWDAIVSKLKSFPVFDNAVETFEETSVRIDEIGLELEPKDDNFYQGQIRFGLRLTPATNKRPRLFNIEVKEFGATLFVDMTVKKTRLLSTKTD